MVINPSAVSGLASGSDITACHAHTSSRRDGEKAGEATQCQCNETPREITVWHWERLVQEGLELQLFGSWLGPEMVQAMHDESYRSK